MENEFFCIVAGDDTNGMQAIFALSMVIDLAS